MIDDQDILGLKIDSLDSLGIWYKFISVGNVQEKRLVINGQVS
jgi:hypothetical protein